MGRSLHEAQPSRNQIRPRPGGFVPMEGRGAGGPRPVRGPRVSLPKPLAGLLHGKATTCARLADVCPHFSHLYRSAIGFSPLPPFT